MICAIFSACDVAAKATHGQKDSATIVSRFSASNGCRFAVVCHKRLPFWGFQGHPEAEETSLRETLNVNDEAAVRAALASGKRIIEAFAKTFLH